MGAEPVQNCWQAPTLFLKEKNFCFRIKFNKDKAKFLNAVGPTKKIQWKKFDRQKIAMTISYLES